MAAIFAILDISCVDPESFVRGGPILTTFFVLFFLVDEGREDPNTTKSGPFIGLLAKRHFMAFCWRANDGPNIE